MRMIAAVLRSGFVREDLVERHVVGIHIVSRRTADHGRVYAQITDERGDRDVHDVIAETPAVGPAAGNGAVAETCLDRAGQRVAAENAQAREAGVVRVRGIARTAACETARAG